MDESDQDHQIGREPMPFIDAVADRGVTRPKLRHGPYAEQIEAAIGRIDDAQHDHGGKKDIQDVMRHLGDSI